MAVGNPVTDLSGPGNYVPVTRALTINGVTYDLSVDRSWTVGGGSVTSVAMSVPTGFQISGSPITSSGTLAVSFASGYSLPTNASQSNWNSAYAFTSTFPTGTASQLLRYNTLGTALEFFTPSYLTPADIIATTPLVWNSGTKTISIPVANNSTNGYLSSTDWLTFSSKQPAITLTTTGNNGASTLIGATLNIPTYTLVGLGGMANPFSAAIGQLIYSNSAGAPLSLAGNTTTTKKFLSQTGDGTNSDAPFWSTISIGDVTGAISLTALSASSPLSYNNSTGVFSIQVATASQNGYLSSTDWVTFSSKQGALTLTTTGNSGSASLIGNTLNVPTYTLVGLGGMSNPFSAAIGQLIYSNSAGAPLSLSPNVTTTKMFLSQTGDGTNSAAPVWEAITASSFGAVPTSRQLTINGTTFDLSANRSWSVGTVTSIGVSMPTGFSVASSPVTSSGTIAVTFASGYSLPTTASQSNWDSAYTNRITSLTTTGNNGPSTLISNTLNIPEYTLSGLGGLNNPFSALGQMIYSNALGVGLVVAPNTTTTKKYLSMTGSGTSGDAPFWDTITASSIGALSSVAIAVPTGFSVSGSPLTSNGTITIGFASGYSLPTTTKQSEWDSAYTNRITSLTTTGNSGAATLISNTLNIPQYTLAGLGGLSNPMTGANGAGDMIYGNGAGAPIRLAPNTTTTKKYLVSFGDGTNGAAPYWDTISGIAGTGTASYIAKFTGTSTLGNSLIYDTGIYVAVGHASPIAMLDVSGSQITRGNHFIGYGSNSEYFIKIGQNRTGNGYAYIDLIGDTTYNDYGARLIRYNTGANTNTYFEHQGTGALIYKTVHAAPIQWETGSTYRGQILSNGRFLYNTSTDDGNLFQINGSTSIASDLIVDTTTFKVDATNNRIGIGTASPQKLVHISGANGATVIRMENTDTSVTSGETIGAIEFYGNDTASGVGAIIDANGAGLSGEINIDIWAGTNGNIVGGLTVKHTGAVNFTPLLSAPSPATAGDVYYDSSTNKLRCYDGISWNDLF